MNDDCGCSFEAGTYQHERTCGGCGAAFRSNHCEHDGVQKPCPWCSWTEPDQRTPLQFLGLKSVPGA